MVMEQLDNEMSSPLGSYKLQRYPVRKKETLRAKTIVAIILYVGDNMMISFCWSEIYFSEGSV